MSAVTLGVKRSQKFPYGPYSPQGLPLCPDHRLTKCHSCADLFPLQVMERKSIGERADTNLRHGMSPRMEKVYASFCPACFRNEIRSRSSRASAEAPNYRLFGILMLIFMVLLVGIGVLIAVSR